MPTVICGHRDKQSYLSNNKAFILSEADSYLLGLLNSKVIWLYLTGICTFVRGGYYELRAIKVETLPVPPATSPQKAGISNLAQKCQELAEQRYTLEHNFRRRLPDLCPPDHNAKLNNKLQNWWQLNFADFQKQIKKQFLKPIPLTERNDWQDYMENEKTKIATLNQQIAQSEIELNQEIYHLFNLTPQEIQLIEA